MFCFGMICSFTALIILGRLTSKNNIYGLELKRFHSFLVPESLYYPTASQMYALARETFDVDRQNKIAVIVGGTSVMYGFGQSVDKLWTEELQRQLGKSYQVLNLALPGAITTEGGALITQSLVKRGYEKIIYVADAYPLVFFQPEGFSVNKYLFWDAYYKDLLLQSTTSKISNNLLALPDSELDNRLLYKLDSLFYFNDFWTAMAYQNLFTIWNYKAAGGTQDSWAWLKPRKHFKDDIINGQGSLRDVYPDSLLEEVLTNLSLRDYCKGVFSETQNNWLPIPEFWNRFNQSIQNEMPNEMKTRTVIFVLQYSPYYTKHRELSSSDKICIQQGVEQTTQAYQNNGFTALNTGRSLSALDYTDHIHLSPTGGHKLAKIIAQTVKERASALGYLSSKN
jgi:hypothetical protein